MGAFKGIKFFMIEKKYFMQLWFLNFLNKTKLKFFYSSALSRVISSPIVNNKEYFMIDDYKSEFDDTYVARGEKVELVNKNINGWAVVRYRNELLVVPYCFMSTHDVASKLNDRIILINR